MQASNGSLDRFLASLPADAAVYQVGSPALGDYSERQSSLDLVVVTPAPPASVPAPPRRSVVLYTTWDSLRRPPAGDHPLATPVTWAILASHPVALRGPARPEVYSDPALVRSWFARQSLPAHGLLWRRNVTRFVLSSLRAAHGAATGSVVSLREAGELALAGITPLSHTDQRVITDALGYRAGATTSMYWGPFERKSNALGLAQRLASALANPPIASSAQNAFNVMARS